MTTKTVTTNTAAAKSANPKKKTKVKNTTTLDTIGTIAANARMALTALAEPIPIDPPPASGSAPARGGRVPDDAMSIVLALLQGNPGRFPDLDSTVIANFLDYEAAMNPFVQQVNDLSAEITRTLRGRRAAAAKVTLGAYRAIKNIDEVTPTTGFPTQQQQLAALLTTVHKVRATSVTVAEKKSAVKAIKVGKAAAVKTATAQESANEAGGTFVPSSGSQAPSMAALPSATPPPAAAPAAATPGR